MMEIRHFLVLIKTEELIGCLIGYRICLNVEGWK